MMTDKDCKKWEKYTERLSKKKTMHELCQTFPNTTYAELEKYRNADRQEEAAQIPLTESQKSQDQLEPIGIGHNNPPEDDEEKHEV